MITEKDLRVGNLIWHTRLNINSNNAEHNVIVVDGNLIKEMELNALMPYNGIPITPNLLTSACDFVALSNNYFEHSSLRLLSAREDANGKIQLYYGQHFLPHIYFIHQLQNFFYAHTNQEIEIKL